MKSLSYAAVLASVLFSSGCGDENPSQPDLVPVKGIVTYDGSPVEQGIIRFAPVDPEQGQPATCQIKNGQFEVFTTASSPGMAVGSYQVSISAVDGTPEPSDPSNPAPPPPNSLIPEKFNNPQTSGLELEVQPGLAPLDWALEE